jgi:VIT1/CCC1 family predicted Fe2+/Mn2+ transporter
MHEEHHFSNRLGWIRAAVMGANDGIISMSGLVMGLAATQISKENLILSSISALFAGAFSMWAGEYISVSSQADSEKSDIQREMQSLEENPREEFLELVDAYKEKGLSDKLSHEVAKELTEKDALKAHLLEELNYDDEYKAAPWQAAFVSFFSFLIGGAVPTLVAIFIDKITLWSYPITLIALIILGYSSARLGGVTPLKGILRITIVGMGILALTNFLGSLYQI